MRTEPTLRIPMGILILTISLILYGIVLANLLPGWIESWPLAVQTAIYLFFGLIWLVPLRRFLMWMETGNWRTPKG